MKKKNEITTDGLFESLRDLSDDELKRLELYNQGFAKWQHYIQEKMKDNPEWRCTDEEHSQWVEENLTEEEKTVYESFNIALKLL